MAEIAREFTVAQKGVGKPDYSREVTKITRGETYPQFEPRAETEKYKIFIAVFIPGAPAPNVPLAIGATAHYIDIETNLPTPYDSPAGYIADFREWFFNLDGRVSFTLVLDGIPMFYMIPDTLICIHEYEQVVWGKTSLFDPDALLPHTWDFAITNLDDHEITGSVHTALVLEVKE